MGMVYTIGKIIVLIEDSGKMVNSTVLVYLQTKIPKTFMDYGKMEKKSNGLTWKWLLILEMVTLIISSFI